MKRSIPDPDNFIEKWFTWLKGFRIGVFRGRVETEKKKEGQRKGGRETITILQGNQKSDVVVLLTFCDEILHEAR